MGPFRTVSRAKAPPETLPRADPRIARWYGSGLVWREGLLMLPRHFKSSHLSLAVVSALGEALDSEGKRCQEML